MALPASAQARLDALRTDAPAAPTPELPAAPVVTKPEVVPPEAESVTISREEFNALQADAGRVKAAEGKADMAQMEIETLQTRLTALEQAAKGSGQDGKPAPAAPLAADDWAPSNVQFTDQEESDYGESRKYIEKVVLAVLDEHLPKLVATINGKVSKISESLENTARRTEQVEGRDFNDQVKNELKNDSIDFDAVVNHQHWKAFTESDDPNTGFTYGNVILGGLQTKNKNVVVRVFRDFAKKYGIGKKQGGTGYEGGIPSGGSKLPETDGAPEMLPFSKRKEAHVKFRNGELSQSDYQKIADDYSKAEREGRIDYDA